MISLLLAVLFSTVVIHCFRYAQDRGFSIDRILLVNYLMAAAVGWTQVAASPASLGSQGLWLWGLALLTGGLFIGNFYLLSYGIETLGPSVAGAAARLSAVLPVLLSVWIFRETPAWTGWLGIALAMAALPLSLPPPALRTKGLGWKAAGPGLLIFFAFGLNDFILKIQNEGFAGSTKPWFLAIVYTTALAIAGLRSAAGGKKNLSSGWGPWLVGGLLGAANYFSTFFLSVALTEIPGSQAYTLGSIGSILLVTLTSLWLWKEPIGPRKLSFLALAVAAVLLIRLP